jgi:hypothetical protein
VQTNEKGRFAFDESPSEEVARLAGIEPTTPWFVDDYSISDFPFPIKPL